MVRKRTVPRPLTNGELIQVLSKEREEQVNQLAKLRNALAEQDYARVAEVVDWLCQPLSESTSKKPEFNNLEELIGEHPDVEEKMVFPYVVKTHRAPSKKQ